MERVAIYCRLSEEDRHKRLVTDDSASIQNQKNMLVQYAVEQHWEIYRIYSDDDYTGADRSRPAFNCLLEDARKRRFSIVLCKTQLSALWIMRIQRIGGIKNPARSMGW